MLTVNTGLLIVIVEDVSTIGPDVLPVLISTRNASPGSLLPSASSVLVKLPVLDNIENEPASTESVKSAALTLPAVERIV
jgi:hypothetical protein